MPLIKTKTGRLINPIFLKKAKGTATQKTKREIKAIVNNLSDRDIRKIIVDLSYKARTRELVADCEDDKSKILVLKDRVKKIMKILKAKGLDLRTIQSKGITEYEIRELLGIELLEAKSRGLYRIYYGRLDDGATLVIENRQDIKEAIEDGEASLRKLIGNNYWGPDAKKITKREIILAMGGIDEMVKHFGINDLTDDFGLRYLIKANGGMQKFYNKYGIKGIKELGLSANEIKTIMSKIKK